MSTSLLSPAGWLVLGLPWPAETREGWGECAVAIAPTMIPRSLVSKGAGIALDLATGLAHDQSDGPGKAVFFSDVTLWLDRQGKAWPDLGIDYEAVIDELLNAQVPQLCLTLTQKATPSCVTPAAKACACTTPMATSNAPPRRSDATSTTASPRA